MLVLKALTSDASDCCLCLPCSPDQAFSGRMVSVGLVEPPFHGSSGFSLCFSSSVRTSAASWALWAPCLLLRPFPSTSQQCFKQEKAHSNIFTILLPSSSPAHTGECRHISPAPSRELGLGHGAGQGHQATALVH